MSGQFQMKTNKKKSEYGRLDCLSMEELEELLDALDSSSTDDAMDTDYLLCILDAIEKKQKENPDRYTLLDAEKAWDNFQKYYLPLLRLLQQEDENE